MGGNQKTGNKKVDNLYFIFPSEGYAYNNRGLFVRECFNVVKENCVTINLPDYHTPIKTISRPVEKKWKKK